MVDPNEDEAPRPSRRRGLYCGVLILLGAGLILSGGFPYFVNYTIGGIPGFGPLPVSDRPASWHYEPRQRAALLAAARGLMADEAKHGSYGARLHARPGESFRPLSELPGPLKALGSAAARVDGEEVSLTWYDPKNGYGYGYSLVLLAEGATDRVEGLRRSDGSFCRNVELDPWVWSTYGFK